MGRKTLALNNNVAHRGIEFFVNKNCSNKSIMEVLHLHFPIKRRMKEKKRNERRKNEGILKDLCA